MLKRTLAVFAALALPYFTFVLVIGLNDSDFERDLQDNRAVNFEVEKKKQLEKPKPKPKKEPRRPQTNEALPTLKPGNLGNSLTGSGLSFGVPQFDEGGFAQFKDNDLLGGGTDQAMDKSTVDTPPKVTRRSPIVYPELARKQGISGYVTMNVLINEDGNVEDVEVIDSKPVEIFDLQADSTMRRWKFEPATYNGKKVKVWATQKIVFKLN